MVAQQKKFVEKPSRTLMAFSVQERNLLYHTKVKIIEKIKNDEEDSFLLLIIALYIAKNGKEKFNAQYMKML